MEEYLYPGTGAKTFLTRGGNILLQDINGKFSFHNPSLEFIREVSQNEGNYILSNEPTKIQVICKLHSEFAKYCVGLGEFPTWYFIKSVLVLDNYSNFRAETSCNGGDYSFSTYHDWYVAQYPDGSWKFAFVERHSTSAEFSYDELARSFQNDLGCLNISNIMGEPMSYQCQQARWWDGEEVHYYSEEVLEKTATMSCFEDMWTEVYEYIPSRWNEDDKGRTYVGHSFADKKQIITRLKELGCIRNKQMGGNRGRKFRSCNRSRR